MIKTGDRKEIGKEYSMNKKHYREDQSGQSRKDRDCSYKHGIPVSSTSLQLLIPGRLEVSSEIRHVKPAKDKAYSSAENAEPLTAL